MKVALATEYLYRKQTTDSESCMVRTQCLALSQKLHDVFPSHYFIVQTGYSYVLTQLTNFW